MKWKPNQNQNQNQNRKWSLKTQKEKIIIAAAFLIAALAVGIFLVAEGRVLANYETQRVVMAVETIPKGIQITKANQAEYLMEQEVPKQLVTNQAVLKKEELIGKVIRQEIHKNAILNSNDLWDKDTWQTTMECPVSVTIQASSVADSVGGSIRGGDLVNVGMICKNEAGVRVYRSVCEQVYVDQALNEKGAVIGKTDSSASTMLKLLMEQEDAEQMLGELRNGEETIVTLPQDTEYGIKG